MHHSNNPIMLAISLDILQFFTVMFKEKFSYAPAFDYFELCLGHDI